MSDPATRDQLIGAGLDADSYDDVVNGGTVPGTVETRRGQTLYTLAKLQALLTNTAGQAGIPTLIAENNFSVNLAPVATGAGNLFDIHLRNYQVGGSSASQYSSAFFRNYTDSGQSSVGQSNNILTALYHSWPFTLPYHSGIETGAIFLDNASAVVTLGIGLRANGPTKLSGGSIGEYDHILIPFVDATANGISTHFALKSESSAHTQLSGIGGLDFTNTSGQNARLNTSGNALLITGGTSGTALMDNSGNAVLTIPAAGMARFNGIGAAGTGTLTNGALLLDATSHFSSADRRWMIANNQNVNGSLSFYPSASATTDPVYNAVSPLFLTADGRVAVNNNASAVTTFDVNSKENAEPATTGSSGSGSGAFRIKASGTNICLDIGASGAGTDNHIWFQGRSAAGYNTNYNIALCPNGGVVKMGTLAIPATGFTAVVAGNFGPQTDNNRTLGSASFRWSTVYAGTGTINTSDADMKDGFRAATKNEIAAAQELAARGKFWQWRDSIAAKGKKGARLHFGPTHQDVVEVFEKYKLDPYAYGMVCRDPLNKSVTKTRPAKRHKVTTEIVKVPSYQIAADSVVMTLVDEAKHTEHFEDKPVVDDKGQPVFENDGQPTVIQRQKTETVSALESVVESVAGVLTRVLKPVQREVKAFKTTLVPVIGPDGTRLQEPKEHPVLLGADGKPLRYFVDKMLPVEEPVMETVTIPAKPLMATVPVMEEYDEEYSEEVQDKDAAGNLLWIKGLRPDQVSHFVNAGLAAAQRAS